MGSYSLSSFKIRLIYTILNENLNNDMPLDKAYAVYFQKLKLESQEQALIIKLVNDVLRRLNYYCYIAGYKKIKDVKRHINKLILVIHMLNDWPLPRDLPDTEDFSLKVAKIRKSEADEVNNLKYGCPMWLDNLCQKEIKDIWDNEKKFLSLEPKRYIRANTLKTTVSDLQNSLLTENIKTVTLPNHPDALEVQGNCALFRTKAFKNGLFEQQDIGSQEIAYFLEVKPGMKVIDACAGFGGKTLHLSALMKGKGSITAMDLKEHKLLGLKERAKRSGAFNITTKIIENSKTIKRLHEKADRVLLDVPCSGLGVLKRNFDTKWVDRTDEIRELAQIQKDILERYSLMTKVGGKLVYSTCSILPMENQNQVKSFLETHPNFKLEDEKFILPSQGGDGFYMARMVRLDAKENLDNDESQENEINENEIIENNSDSLE